MKKLLLILISFILIIGFLIGGSIGVFLKFKTVAHSEEKFLLPDITLKDFQNNKVKFNKIKKPTIMIFLLPQSKSCQQQLETLALIKNNYNNRLDILAIAIGNIAKNKIKQLELEQELSIPILIDKNAELTEKFKISTIPTLVFYNPYEKPIKSVGLKKEKELQKMIKSYLPTLANK